MRLALFPRPSDESPPMFASAFVDRFSRTHPAFVPIVFVPAVAILFAYSVGHVGKGALASLGTGVLGLLMWTVTEYFLHRYFFHWIPRSRWGPKLHFLVHGVHHTWPRDRYRLVMPPAVSISLFWFFFGIFFLVLGPWSYAFMAGFTLGYMAYDMIHYYVHHFAPRHPLLKALRRHHLMHHSKKHDGTKFGVSTPMWDFVFGTVGESHRPEDAEPVA